MLYYVLQSLKKNILDIQTSLINLWVCFKKKNIPHTILDYLTTE